MPCCIKYPKYTHPTCNNKEIHCEHALLISISNKNNTKKYILR